MNRTLMGLMMASGVIFIGAMVWLGLMRSGGARLEQAASTLAGSSVCRECHESFYQRWASSHHGLAMQPFTPAFANEHLTPQAEKLVVGREHYQVEWNRQGGWIRSEGPQGSRRYPILHVMGGKNVFYLLTMLDRGRLQVLPAAYDVRQKSWYDMAASGVRHFPDMLDAPFHWTGRPYTFNVACFNCHVSQLSQNYEPKTDSYHTTWTEPGINCETCHGPAGKHVQMARSALKRNQKLDPASIISTKSFSPNQVNSLCAPCHAKMIPLTTRFAPGEDYFDHFDLTTFEHPDYYVDGRDLGENYTFTSWRRNPCLAPGRLDCTHCHTSSGRYRFAHTNSDQSCLPCHQAIVSQIESHTHHSSLSSGSRCVSCHMPTTVFARMRRTDHSCLPPTPAASIAFQSPNACNLCHTNQDTAWADRMVRQWYRRDYQAPVLERARLVLAARTNDWTRLAAMLDYLRSPQREEITSASLIRLIQQAQHPSVRPALIQALRDPSPLVRASAAESLAFHADSTAASALIDACRDDVRLVRIRAASALARVPHNDMHTNDIPHVQKAMVEYEQSLEVRPDDAASLHNKGNHYMALERWDAALKAFDAASRLQPEIIAPLVNASVVYSRLGDNGNAERCLLRALEHAPTNASVNFNLGLLLAEEQRPLEAEAALRLALKSDPQLAAAAYNLGVLVAAHSLSESVEFMRRAVALDPDDERYVYTLAFYLRQKGEAQEAIQVLRECLNRMPSTTAPYVLLANLYLERGQRALADAIYQEAMINEKIPFPERQRLQTKP